MVETKNTERKASISTCRELFLLVLSRPPPLFLDRYATYVQLNYLEKIKSFFYGKEEVLPYEETRRWKEPQLKHTPPNEQMERNPKEWEASNCFIENNCIVLHSCNIVAQIIRAAELKMQKVNNQEENTSQPLTKDLLLQHTHLEKLKVSGLFTRRT